MPFFMGVLVQIRDVDEAVREQLKARAAAEGVSFNSYLRGLLADEAARPTRAEVLQRIRERTERATVGSAGVVRAGREERAGQVLA